MKSALTTLLLVIISTLVSAQGYQNKAIVTEVIDGDTFKADVKLGYGVTINIPVRVFDLDAPEFTSKDSLQNAKAVQATAEATKLLKGKEIMLLTDGKQSFNRWVCMVLLEDKKDFTEVMVERGMGKRIRKPKQ